MRITLIDSVGPSAVADRIAAAVGIRSARMTTHRLADEPVAPCRGGFACWTDHPGVCTFRDHAAPMVEDLISGDAVAFVTRPRFGTWDPGTKAVLDRSINLLSPFFEVSHGETQRVARYERYPKWMVFAVGPLRADERRMFETLVHRNVVNLHSHAPWLGFIDEDMPLAAIDAKVGAALATLATPNPDPFREVPDTGELLHREGLPRSDDPRRVLIWIGSAKPDGESTSEALGRALGERLTKRGWSMEVITGVSAAKHPERLSAAVARADLVVPTTPVYIDTLPTVVLQGLHHLADHPTDKRVAWMPIVQCGFPEISYTRLAIDAFQRVAGFRGDTWVGHLAMGQGELLRGRSPDALGPAARPQSDALDRAAAAIDEGRPVSRAIASRFAEHVVPDAVYRKAGEAGWMWRAWRQGVASRLRDTPYADRLPHE